ncbi:MAG: hypothetical protein DLM72_15270 [Candidatus Nitrosopolaris wilkensis]|nr:MAG: hypothetical protein DLM72_15270 [Candidatus Nitrosopolaris wilkensis]
MEVKLHIEVDGTFSKASLEHIDYEVFNAEPINGDPSIHESRGVLITKKITLDDIDKTCEIEREIKKAKGVKRVHYIHFSKIAPKHTYKKYNHPITIIVYTTILFTLALYSAIITGQSQNITNMIIVISVPAATYFIVELILYLKGQIRYNL